MGQIFSSTIEGINGIPIEIEAVLEASLPQIHITGLPGPSVKESRDRVRAALQGLGYEIPSQKTVVHLSPAEAKKQGSQFDLAIAIAILNAEKKIALCSQACYAFLGELTLDGRIRGIQSAVALAEALSQLPNLKWLIAPDCNALELSMIPTDKIRVATSLKQVMRFFAGQEQLKVLKQSTGMVLNKPADISIDEVLGHPVAKRAVQIAIAGRHHLLLSGPPGIGKSFLARSAESLLPPLKKNEAMEVVKNHSQVNQSFAPSRPFRSPHHTISAQAFLGGGHGCVQPGEVTLADLGVLFLDEFPEFHRDAIEGLREPLEDRNIHIHRVGKSLRLPSRCTIIAAMNPCPCGYYKSTGSQRCSCSREQVMHYRRRVSGPIIDRMDLFVLMEAVSKSAGIGRTHAEMFEEVCRVWEIQSHRYGSDLQKNGTARMDSKAFELRGEALEWFHTQVQQSILSTRALMKLIRVARTIADLNGCDEISKSALFEAFALRCHNQILQP